MAVLDALLLAPWLWHRFIPSMDLPNHAAAAAVVGQALGLTAGDGMEYYALHGQWAPYHLAQVLLVPCVAMAGPVAGAKLGVGLGLVLHLAAFHWGLRQMGRSWMSHLLAGPLIYGASFFWGYLPMWIGTPGWLVAAAALAPTPSRPPRLDLAAAGTLWALAAHLLWLPALGLLWALHLGARRRVAALGLGALALLVAPWLVSSLLHGGELSLGWGSLEQRLFQLKRLWAPFDRGVGRAAAWVLLLLALARVVQRLRFRQRLRSRSGPQAQLAAEAPLLRYGLALIAGGILLVAAFPLQVQVGSSFAWGISFRYAPVVWLGLAVGLGAHTPPRWLLALPVAAALFALSLWPPWSAFDRHARTFWPHLEELPLNARLLAPERQQSFGDFWPAVDHHLPAWHVARGGAWASTIFAGGHAPIEQRRNSQPTHEAWRDDTGQWRLRPVGGAPP